MQSTKLVTPGHDAANRNLDRVVIVPLTSKIDRQYPGEALVTLAGKDSKAMADQIMTAANVRLKNQIGTFSRIDMLAIEGAILLHLGIRNSTLKLISSAFMERSSEFLWSYQTAGRV